MRTTLKRHPERALFEREDLYRILDESLVVHVGVSPALVLPMAFGRDGDTLYLHGAVANALLSHSGEVCVTATLVDGLVLAKAAFRHSMNYRSAVIFGALREVEGGEKVRALEAILEHALPGRALECRAPSKAELAATRVLAIGLEEASVKVRSGPPRDADVDVARDVWAGVLPLRVVADAPEALASRVPSAAVSAALRAHAPRLEGREDHSAFVVDPDPARLDLDRVLVWIRDESYWGASLTAETLLRSLRGAYVVGAYLPDATMIGFARVVTDEVSIAWLGDVFVDSAHRGRGVATAMIDFLLTHSRLSGVRKWILGTRDAHSLYTRFGFEPAPDGRYMLRERNGDVISQ